MMKTIHALVFDLDGSLLNHYKDVSPANRDLLHQLHEKGCLIGIASGRTTEDVLGLLKRFHLDSLISFIIASNGCSYMNLITGKRIEEGYLDATAYDLILDKLKGQTVSCGRISENRLCFDRPNLATWLYSFSVGKHPLFVPSCSGEEVFPKIYVVGFPIHLKKARKSLKNGGWQVIPSGRYSLEVVSKGISKGSCLDYVLEDFSLEPEHILSFGDDYNDLELIRRTCGVAMKNAVPAICKAADSVTKYNANQDGVAYHLNQMILGGHYVFKNPYQQDSE